MAMSMTKVKQAVSLRSVELLGSKLLIDEFNRFQAKRACWGLNLFVESTKLP